MNRCVAGYSKIVKICNTKLSENELIYKNDPNREVYHSLNKCQENFYAPFALPARKWVDKFPIGCHMQKIGLFFIVGIIQVQDLLMKKIRSLV